jgi:hypothetical protein
MEENYTGTVQKDHAEFARQWLANSEYAKDFEVVVAEGNQLMLDYDTTTLPVQFQVAMDILKQTVNTAEDLPFELSVSKSGNLHVIVTLPYSMGDTKRIAWQAAFGSDPKREALHLLSIARHELNPILLYNRKKPQLMLGTSQ